MTAPPAPNSPAAPDARSAALQRLLDRPVLPAILSADTQAAAQPVETRSRATTGVLIFNLGAETLALPARALRRVTPLAVPTPVPHARTSLLRGVCNIQGELILCGDLHALLTIPRESRSHAQPNASDPRRMIVIGPPDASWVFQADALVGIDRIDPAALLPPPLTVARAAGEFVAGLFDTAGTRVTLLDDKKVLAGLEAPLA